VSQAASGDQDGAADVRLDYRPTTVCPPTTAAGTAAVTSLRV
jgi:hypothetical protein